MLGTIVNCGAVLVGSLIGLLIKNGINERFRIIIINAIGLAVFFIGLSGALAKLILPEANIMLMVASLVIGGLIGEAADIDRRLNSFGDLLQKKLFISESGLPNSDINFSRGFVTASLMFCVGTMAILGSFESGVQGVHNTLFAKSVLDGITAMIFASYMGIGVVFSAVSVFLYQGALTLLAVFIAPYLTEDMIFYITVTGGVLVAALGLDMLGAAKIKVVNLLPAVFVPVAYFALLN